MIFACAAMLTTLLCGTTQPPVTLTAVQMRVNLEDYRSPDAFAAAVDRCMKSASSHFGPGQNLVAFPEDTGLGLLFLDHYDDVKSSKSFEQAAHTIAGLYADQIKDTMAKNNCSLARALCIVRGRRMKQVYSDTFSQAALKYKATIIAGSASIPGKDGNIYNTSYVFGPDGKLLGEQNKVHLVDMELGSGLDLTPGTLEQTHPIDTPAGRIGVAICWDGFFDDVVNKLVSEGARILIQPAFNYDPWNNDEDQEWKTGMWKAVQNNKSLIAGMTPMMVGSLWDIKVEGRSAILGRTSTGYLARSVKWTNEEVVTAEVK